MMATIACILCRVRQPVASVGLGEPDPADVALLLENGWLEAPQGLLCPSCGAHQEFMEQEDQRDAFTRVGSY